MWRGDKDELQRQRTEEGEEEGRRGGRRGEIQASELGKLWFDEGAGGRSILHLECYSVAF